MAVQETANFRVTGCPGQYYIRAVTPMAVSLMRHCKFHGRDVTGPYGSMQAAKEHAMDMDYAIANRLGREWVAYRDRRN